MIAARRLATAGLLGAATCLLGAAAGLLGATAQSAAAAAPALPATAGWLRAETQNFQLLSNAGERKTREIGNRLERFRQVLMRLKSGQDFVPPMPLRIFVFKNDAAFKPYKQGQSEEEGLLGFFLHHAHGQYIAINAYPRQYDVLPVIFHEYVHFYVRANFPRIPLWANEGLAEYYSSFLEFPDEVRIGEPVGHHVIYLRQHSFLPFERLFAIGVDSPEYSESEKKGAFYAQSWALVHYLMSGAGPPAADTNLFLGLLGAGEAPAAACERGLKLTLAQLEAKLRGYVNQRLFPVHHFRLTDLPEPRHATVLPLPGEAVLFHLGDLLAHSASDEERLQLAEAHFRASRELNPAYGDPLAGLAFVASQREEPAAAGLAREALDVGASSPQALLIYAEIEMAALREAEAATTGAGAAGRHQRARAALERLLDQAPAFAAARALLGETYFYDDDGAEQGVAELSRASRELPERADVVFNLAMMTLKSGDAGAARRIVEERLVPLGETEWVARAREAVNRSELISAVNAAASGGEDDRAVELMRRARDAATAPEVRASLERQLAELEAQARHNGQVRRYNAAVEKANRGEFAEALAMLRALAPEVGEEALLESVTHLIAELEELVAPR